MPNYLLTPLPDSFMLFSIKMIHEKDRQLSSHPCLMKFNANGSRNYLPEFADES